MGSGIWWGAIAAISLLTGNSAALAVNLVKPTLETPSIINPPGDADDPAIWVHPTDPSLSLVLGTKKDAGLSVYDLGGNELQSISPKDIRYNNIDVQYGFNLGGERIDLAVTSDRRNDTLKIFNINPDTRQLEDITASGIGPIFTAPVFTPPDQLEEGTTAYGLTLYRSPISDKYYTFVSRNDTGEVAQLELFDNGAGQVGATLVRSFNVSSQVEGMVADQQLGYVYVGEEEVGIWKFLAEPDGGTTGTLIDAVKPEGNNLEADAEGLTIYYGDGRLGYLVASSQGDSTFAVYSRDGDNDYLGSFSVGEVGEIDGVDESDGADVVNVPLGSLFPFGLFVTHDGSNEPEVLVFDEDDQEFENANTNFKFVPWERVANAFSPNSLLIDTTSYNPRNPNSQSVPEPTTSALALLAPIALVGQLLRRRGSN